MVNDNVVKCPLCGGFTHIEKTDLLGALKNPRLRGQIELYVAELLKSPVEELATVRATEGGSDFQKDVHSWNPCVPMWRRSPKE
jgi:ABC-type glutathione transport system ATPase component